VLGRKVLNRFVAVVGFCFALALLVPPAEAVVGHKCTGGLFQCAADEFCEFPTGNCGGLVPGKCVKFTVTCPKPHGLVCGCDGVNYGSDCVRRQVGVSKERAGGCPPPKKR
jgi:hypothetical protein